MRFVDKVNLVIACDNMIAKYQLIKKHYEDNRSSFIRDGEDYYLMVLKTADDTIAEYTELREKLSKERCEI